MTKSLALSALVLAGAATLAPPAAAAPCDPATSVAYCLKPQIERIGHQFREVRDDVVCPLGVC